MEADQNVPSARRNMTMASTQKAFHTVAIELVRNASKDSTRRSARIAKPSLPTRRSFEFTEKISVGDFKFTMILVYFKFMTSPDNFNLNQQMSSVPVCLTFLIIKISTYFLFALEDNFTSAYQMFLTCSLKQSSKKISFQKPELNVTLFL